MSRAITQKMQAAPQRRTLIVTRHARTSCTSPRCAFLLTLELLACPAAVAQITLVNAGSSAGLNAVHAPDAVCFSGNQWWMTGGATVGDFNNDLFPDIFVIGGGLAPDRLFINQRNGTFTERAAAWGIAALHGGNGASVADCNNDGWLDIYVTSFGPVGQFGQPGKHRLYLNDGGDNFTNVALQAGVNTSTTVVPSGYGSAWGDYDLDGYLDLFVASWKDTNALGNGGTGNRLFHNNRNGTFTDVTATAMPHAGGALAGVWGFQPAFVDMNSDLFPEILIAADFNTSRLLLNQGDATYTNFTVPSGTGLDDNGMGQTVADFNNDGLLDWYVTSIFKDVPQVGAVNGNMLYLNQDGLQFTETSVAAGVNDGGWGWGALAVDLDNDGWTDLLEANGRNAGEWANEREYLWRNNGNAGGGGGGGTFTEIGQTAGLDLAGEARCVVWLDADRDGDQDLVITVNNGALRYYRNDTAGGNWIHVNLDTATNPLLAPNGFGSRIMANAGAQTHVAYLSGSPSYLGTSELAIHFGLGESRVIEQLQITWPRGYVTTLSNVAVNQFLTVAAPIPADITADGTVAIDDLLAIVNNWGPCPNPCLADTDASGVVDIDDLLAIVNNWD